MITPEEIAEGFARLAAREWRAKEARPFTRRLKALPSVSAPFLIDRLATGNEREREVASALLGEMEGPRVIAPLRDLLRDRGASPAVRIAAAAILHKLGESPPLYLLSDMAPEPDRLISESWEHIFAGVQHDEAAREQFLANLEEEDAETQNEILRSMVETRDERALALLLPLLYTRRAATIVAAIDVIEALGSLQAAPILEERARWDPNATVRKRAAQVQRRLLMRVNPLLPDTAPLLRAVLQPPEPLPLHRAYLTLQDRYGDQAILVSRRRPNGFLKTVTVLIGEREGIKSCFGVDMMEEAELDEIANTLTRHGLTPVHVGLGECRNALREARQRSLLRRRRPPMEVEIWKSLFDGPEEDRPHEPATPELPEWMGLLSRTGALLSMPEFRQWCFGEDLVGPFVEEWCAAPFEEQQGEHGQRLLEHLIDLAIKDLIDPELRMLLSHRLARQALLLERLGKKEAASLVTAAARGLDPHQGIPLDRHPFVRALIMSSLLNAGLRPPVGALPGGRL